MKPTTVLLPALAFPPVLFHFAATATILIAEAPGENGIALLRATLTQAQPSSKDVIQVEIDGLRNDKGQVLCALFSSANDFPKKTDKAVAHAESVISQGHASCEFRGVAAGRYAVSVFHDENSNGKLDTNFMGIPREGVGASNGAKGHMGPPKIRGCCFSLFGRPTGTENHGQLLIGALSCRREANRTD
jgi:uncharacterized protein (DUF2141 family)